MAKEVKKRKCTKCKSQDGLPKHYCPYKGDVEGDYSKHCNCCETCQGECSADI